MGQGTCGWCSGRLPPYVGTGRPRIFCTSACKLFYENARGRLERRLVALDDSVARWERALHRIDFSGSEAHAQEMYDYAITERRRVQDEFEATVRRAERYE